MSVNDDDLALYGKAFDDVEEGDAVSKKPLSIENQIVTDEKGRRRFHGAFTGGFSAGFFNTVGTLEGWAPSTFVSNRATRAEKKSFRPEDFMDKEDLGEYGIAPRLIKTTKDFTEEERTTTTTNEKDRKRHLAWEHTELAVESDRLADLIKPVSDSIGVQMLKKMGWRPGKGVGPLVSKTNVVGDFKFAPDDVEFHVYEPKSDLHGMGYSGLDASSFLVQTSVKESALKVTKHQKKGIQGQAFGVGAYEEEDEDIYGSEDLTKYDFVLGGSLPSRFDNKTEIDDDFEVSKNLLPPRKFFLPPKISRDYTPSNPFAGKTSKKTILSSSVASTSTTTNPVERAAQLGESHSVWSLVSDTDRRRIEEIKNVKKFQSANDERRSRFDRKTPPPKVEKREKIVEDLRPRHEKQRGDMTIPVVYPNDKAKQQRFEEFVNCIKRGLCMPQPLEMTDWEWESEQDEFRKQLPDDLKQNYIDAKLRQKPLCQTPAAQPFAFMMKSKFTHAKFDDDAEKQTNEDEDKLKAVQLKMFGAMTREKHEWHPHKNLCKRFNLPNPYPDSHDYGVPHFKKETMKQRQQQAVTFNILGDSFQSTSLELSRKRAAAREAELLKEQQQLLEKAAAIEEDELKKVQEISDDRPIQSEQIEPSFEEEIERPPMDLFRAIFADDDESNASSSSEEEKEVEEQEKNVENNKDDTTGKNFIEQTRTDLTELLISVGENQRPSTSFSSTTITTSSTEEKRTTSSIFNSTTIVDVLTYGPTLPPSENSSNERKVERKMSKEKKPKHHHKKHSKKVKKSMSSKHHRRDRHDKGRSKREQSKSTSHSSSDSDQ